MAETPSLKKDESASAAAATNIASSREHSLNLLGEFSVTAKIQTTRQASYVTSLDAALCHRCAQFLLAVLSRTHRPQLLGRFLWSRGATEAQYFIYVHHDSGKALDSSAKAGCILCQVILNELSYNGDDRIVLGFHQPAVPRPSKDGSFFDRDSWTFSPVTKTEFMEDQDRSRTLLKRRGLEIVIALDPRDCMRLSSPTAFSPNRMLPHFPPFSSQSFDRIRQWIKECNTEHEHCQRHNRLSISKFQLPKRLLDLEATSLDEPKGKSSRTSRQVEQHFVALRETAKIKFSREKLRYVALSYCWGGWDGLVTNKSNIQTMYESVPEDLLPQTIRDAIYVCRLCGVRFLWVDALCICQDDADDWQQESECMSDVYSGCNFAISALSSAAAKDGFLHQRGFEPVRLSSAWATEKSKRQTTGLYVRYSPMDIDDEILSAPLTTRGWALQEWILAPAVLHFGSDQLMWECNTVNIQSETGEQVDTCPVNVRLPNVPGAQTYGIAKQALWEAVVEKFTRRSLSYATDRVPAVTGLAKRLRDLRVCNGAFIAGMWEESLRRQLLWCAPESHEEVFKAHAATTKNTEDKPKAPVGDKTAPTWSWVHCDRPVSFPLMELIFSQTFEGPSFEVLDIPSINPIHAVSLKAIVQEFDLSEILDVSSPSEYQDFRYSLQAKGASLELDERPIRKGRYFCIRLCAASWGFTHAPKDRTMHHVVVRKLEPRDENMVQGQKLLSSAWLRLPLERSYLLCVRVGLLTFSRGSECMQRILSPNVFIDKPDAFKDVGLGNARIMDVRIV